MEYKGYTIEVKQDEIPESPREWDNLGTMVCFHNKYNLGDKHEITSSDFNSWNEVENHLKKENDIAIILPLYLYDHSGLRIKIGSFQGHLPQGHAEFDSGMIGFIYITKEKIRKEYGCKHITKKWIEKVTGYLENEVKTYDQFISGDVWYYVVEDENGEDIDCCGGIYGQDEAENQAKEMVDHEIKKHGEQLKMELV